MVIIVTLAILLLLFFIMRKHSGPALLAMIAGVAVYQLFGTDLASQINAWMPSWNPVIIKNVVYVVFVAVFPLILYFRSNRGGLFGIFRLVQSVIIAVILTAMLAEPLAQTFGFDTLARDIANWIDSAFGTFLLAGVLGAYIDILLNRSE